MSKVRTRLTTMKNDDSGDEDSTQNPSSAQPGPSAPGSSLRTGNGRRLAVTCAGTRRNPNHTDTTDDLPLLRQLRYSAASNAIRPDATALHSTQLLEIASKLHHAVTTETPDSTHSSGEPFYNPLAYIYATGAPFHKGISEKEHEHIKTPSTRSNASGEQLSMT